MKLFVLLFSVGIALVCFWASLRLLYTRRKVKKWERIHATVFIKELAYRQGPARNATFVLDVWYRYYLHGNEYTGKNVELVNLLKGHVYYTQKNGQKKLSQVDNKPLIYVNPKSPADSVIYLPGAGFYYFIFLMGILSLLAGAGNYFA